MGDYSIQLKPSARKELEALPDRILARIVQKLELLSITPRPAGCKKLKGISDTYRVRVGDYRILYRIEDSLLIIEVIRIANRKDAYKL